MVVTSFEEASGQLHMSLPEPVRYRQMGIQGLAVSYAFGSLIKIFAMPGVVDVVLDRYVLPFAGDPVDDVAILVQLGSYYWHIPGCPAVGDHRREMSLTSLK
jgi:hypothetical protein